MIGAIFKIKDIPESVILDAINEAEAIYESSYAKSESLSGRSRTKRDIQRDTLQGKLGEYFLIKMFGYINDEEKWHDLISPDGERTEVKTWRKSDSIEYKIKQELIRIKEKKSSPNKWFFSTKLVVIEYDVLKNELEINSIHNI